MENKRLLIQNVEDAYQWLDEQIERNVSREEECSACGACCNFSEFDHRLYVTSPELIYFNEKIGSEGKPLRDGICPYNQNGKCTVYENRFAGCRIFFCRADVDFQNQLSESAVRRFKKMCLIFDVHYRYTDLESALSETPANICPSAGEQPAEDR